MARAHRKNRALGLFLAVLTSVLWGLVPLAGKIALPGITAATLSATRLFLGSLFLALVIIRAAGLKSLAMPAPRLVVPEATGPRLSRWSGQMGTKRGEKGRFLLNWTGRAGTMTA